jgi:predicted DNA-binding transcriptional regulator AlpA
MPTNPLDPHHPRTTARRLSTAGLDAIAADPATATTLPAEAVTALLTQLTVVQSALMARLLSIPATLSTPDDDRLLTVAEAADKLACSVDWLYRHAKKLPFIVRPTGSQGALRFASRGIEHYLQRRTGSHASGGSS